MNSIRTLNLDILACDNGSSESIFIPLPALLDEYNAWGSVKKIISDTAAVNTGQKIVFLLESRDSSNNIIFFKGLDKPQFIGCQHYILSLVLWHLLDSLFPICSQSLNINYQFIKNVLAGYEDLDWTK